MTIKSIWLRKIHKWVGLVIGLQFVVWAISGTAMALLPMDEVAGGEMADQAAPAIPTEGEAWPKVQAALAGQPIMKLSLRSLRGRQALEVTTSEGVRLFDAPVLELGRLANAVARARHGDQVFFTVNRQLNPTNVCVLACRFCDYAKKPDAPGAYTMTREQIEAHVDPEITEIHIVGGLHNQWRFDDYLNVIRWVKEEKPSLSVKARGWPLRSKKVVR